jgi:hypothetical protein
MISPLQRKKILKWLTWGTVWLCRLLLKASAKRKPALIGNVLGELFENMMGTHWEQTIDVNV